MKGCKDLNNVLKNERKSQVSAKLKWVEKNYLRCEEIDWYNIFELPFKVTKDFKLQ